jgi:hypothetical protein
MNPIDWLSVKAPGFSDLSETEQAAIMHFSLLWSFFEAETLNTNASAKSITALVEKWETTGQFEMAQFETCITYFRNRYFEVNNYTSHFHGLNLRTNDNPQLVEAMLKGENTNPSDDVAALLIIVFRLRNNLFHGVKWANGIQGQLDNFTNANEVLMKALDTHHTLCQ